MRNTLQQICVYMCVSFRAKSDWIYYLGGRPFMKHGVIKDRKLIKHSYVFFIRVTDSSSQLTLSSWSKRNFFKRVFISNLLHALKSINVTSTFLNKCFFLHLLWELPQIKDKMPLNLQVQPDFTTEALFGVW